MKWDGEYPGNATCFIVAQDVFLSEWGLAPGRSLVAVPVPPDIDAEELALFVKRTRSDFNRVRIAKSLPRLKDGDHGSVVTGILKRYRKEKENG